MIIPYREILSSQQSKGRLLWKSVHWTELWRMSGHQLGQATENGGGEEWLSRKKEVTMKKKTWGLVFLVELDKRWLVCLESKERRRSVPWTLKSKPRVDHAGSQKPYLRPFSGWFYSTSQALSSTYLGTLLTQVLGEGVPFLVATPVISSPIYFSL